MTDELAKRDVMTLEWLTPSEVARRWRVSPDSILRWIKAGKLAASKLPGGKYRVKVETVEAYESPGTKREKRKLIFRSTRPSLIDSYRGD